MEWCDYVLCLGFQKAKIVVLARLPYHVELRVLLQLMWIGQVSVPRIVGWKSLFPCLL